METYLCYPICKTQRAACLFKQNLLKILPLLFSHTLISYTNSSQSSFIHLHYGRRLSKNSFCNYFIVRFQGGCDDSTISVKCILTQRTYTSFHSDPSNMYDILFRGTIEKKNACYCQKEILGYILKWITTRLGKFASVKQAICERDSLGVTPNASSAFYQ